MKVCGTKGLFRRIISGLKSSLSAFGEAQRQRAAAVTAFEARELENLFVLLLLGSFTGIPAPPSFLAVELLPFLEHELFVLQRRAQESTDALAELAAILDLD